jgi:hypothetical protein
MYVQQWPFLVCRRFLWRISRHNSLMILFEACSSTVFFSFYANTSVNLRILPDGQPESAWLWSRRLAMVRPASPCPRRKLSPYLPAPNEFADIAEGRIMSQAFGIFIEIAFI